MALPVVATMESTLEDNLLITWHALNRAEACVEFFAFCPVASPSLDLCNRDHSNEDIPSGGLGGNLPGRHGMISSKSPGRTTSLAKWP